MELYSVTTSFCTNVSSVTHISKFPFYYIISTYTHYGANQRTQRKQICSNYILVKYLIITVSWTDNWFQLKMLFQIKFHVHKHIRDNFIMTL